MQKVNLLLLLRCDQAQRMSQALQFDGGLSLKTLLERLDVFRKKMTNKRANEPANRS